MAVDTNDMRRPKSAHSFKYCAYIIMIFYIQETLYNIYLYEYIYKEFFHLHQPLQVTKPI